MPRINPSTGAVVMGVAGAVSIDGEVYADRGTNASWLHPSTIIAQCGDDGWRVGICEVGAPKQWAAYDARGCNFLSAGGGLWQAELAGSGSFGEYGDQPHLSLGLLDGDGRGYPGPGGEMNLVPAGGLGIQIHTRGVGVYAIACGPARFVQVLGPQAAVWADDAGLFFTEGIPAPAQTAPGSSPHYCPFPDGTVWNVYFSSAHGLIAHPWDDASEGVVLAGPGVPAWFPDARVVNGKLIAAWSSGAGELPHELVVARDVLSLPRVVFDAVTPPTPVPPNPEPPNPEPGPEPEPPMHLVYDFSPCQAYADQRWPQMAHSTGHEQSANMATILYELRAQGHPFEMFLKSSGQAWIGWDGQSYSEDVCVVVQDGAKWWKDIIVRCGAPDAYISFGNAHDYQRPNPPSDEAKCVPPPTPPTAPPQPEPEPPPLEFGAGYLQTDFGDYLRAKRKSGELERGESQLLTVADEGEGRVSIRIAGSGKYVCVDPNVPEDPLYANRASVGPWERFHVEPRDGDRVAFKAEANGLYLCAEDTGRIVANRPTVGPWETFIFVAD